MTTHLQTIAMAVADRTLVTGGSGIARCLPEAYRQQKLLTGINREPHLPDVSGRSPILSGSCSPATNGQVAAHEDQVFFLAALMSRQSLNDRGGELAKITAWSRTADVSTAAARVFDSAAASCRGACNANAVARRWLKRSSSFTRRWPR